MYWPVSSALVLWFHTMLVSMACVTGLSTTAWLAPVRQWCTCCHEYAGYTIHARTHSVLFAGCVCVCVCVLCVCVWSWSWCVGGSEVVLVVVVVVHARACVCVCV